MAGEPQRSRAMAGVHHPGLQCSSRPLGKAVAKEKAKVEPKARGEEKEKAKEEEKEKAKGEEKGLHDTCRQVEGTEGPSTRGPLVGGT